MKTNRFLYDYSVVVFVLFFVFALWAFWPGYFSHLGDQEEVRYHTHGIAMTLWCMMLIGQAWLIRKKRFVLHRRLGTLSYFLMPVLLILTLNLVHHLLSDQEAWNPVSLYSLALMVNATIVLAILYGLAIYHRRRPLLHARYMLGTVFPLFTPVTDRLIYGHFKPLLNYMPTIEGRPIAPVAGFLLADLLLLLLVYWDWKTHQRLDVFPKVLALLVIYHISVLTFYRFAFWEKFGNWFLSLPLS